MPGATEEPAFDLDAANRELAEATPEAILAWTWTRFQPKVILTCSFQHDAVVLERAGEDDLRLKARPGPGEDGLGRGLGQLPIRRVEVERGLLRRTGHRATLTQRLRAEQRATGMVTAR